MLAPSYAIPGTAIRSYAPLSCYAFARPCPVLPYAVSYAAEINCLQPRSVLFVPGTLANAFVSVLTQAAHTHTGEGEGGRERERGGGGVLEGLSGILVQVGSRYGPTRRSLQGL
eukprot:1325293-Rhodomonas_salina.1